MFYAFKMISTLSTFTISFRSAQTDGERGESFGNTHPKSMQKICLLLKYCLPIFRLTEPRIGRPRQ